MGKNFMEAERRYLDPDSGVKAVPMWHYEAMKKGSRSAATEQEPEYK